MGPKILADLELCEARIPHFSEGSRIYLKTEIGIILAGRKGGRIISHYQGYFQEADACS